jgi:PIN domain nuclease of toxin-antitoxin system
MSSLLLDTCAAIFIVDEAISAATERLLTDRYNAGEAIYVSPYSAWELASLLKRGRLRVSVDAGEYFRNLVSLPGFTLAPLPPEVLIASWFLPGDPPRDPADRIIAATARAFSYTLLTRDRELLGYAREGHLSALEC